MKEKYSVDKNYILGTISAKCKTVRSVAKELGVAYNYFYVAINRTYRSPRSLFISKVIQLLELDASLVWRKE